MEKYLLTDWKKNFKTGKEKMGKLLNIMFMIKVYDLNKGYKNHINLILFKISFRIYFKLENKFFIFIGLKCKKFI